MTNETPAQRLGRYVRARRKELKMTQADVQKADGPSTATLRLIEGGKHAEFRDGTGAALEAALKWRFGSIDETLAGGEPTPIYGLHIGPDVTAAIDLRGDARHRSASGSYGWSSEAHGGAGVETQQAESIPPDEFRRRAILDQYQDLQDKIADAQRVVDSAVKAGALSQADAASMIKKASEVERLIEELIVQEMELRAQSIAARQLKPEQTKGHPDQGFAGGEENQDPSSPD